MSKYFLFAARGIDYDAQFYKGTSVIGNTLAVVTEDDFNLNTVPDIGDFVSETMYWLQGKGDKPKGVIAAQIADVSRLVQLMTKTLQEA